MNTKTFEKNPMTGRLTPVIILGIIGFAAGAAILVYADSDITGWAVIVGTALGEGILIADALANLACPDCGCRLHRDRVTGKYICNPCATYWELPAKRPAAKPPSV